MMDSEQGVTLVLCGRVEWPEHALQRARAAAHRASALPIPGAATCGRRRCLILGYPGLSWAVASPAHV